MGTNVNLKQKTIIFQCHIFNIINDTVLKCSQNHTKDLSLWADHGNDVFLSHDKLVYEPGSERVVLCTVLMGF